AEHFAQHLAQHQVAATRLLQKRATLSWGRPAVTIRRREKHLPRVMQTIEPIVDPEAICAVINDAAIAYRGVIPADCWHEPYMPLEELQEEMEAGVEFSCARRAGRVAGVMGLQRVA